MVNKGLLNTVTPECRYGHGRLVQAEDRRWSLVSIENQPLAFTVKVFVCHTCGYMELFDDDPVATAGLLGAK